nr:uncharacterized protein LOC131784887 isoform X2 [Pocillopora verrucosa]
MTSQQKQLILFVPILLALSVKNANTCTSNDFERASKACVTTFASNLREAKDKTCRNHYAEMQTCIGRALHRCKNSSDSTTLGKINQIKRVAAASEEYYCSYGGVNPDPFNGKVMQGCRKKAHKKMRKCPASFHKRFSDDNGSTALCRKYSNLKKCVIKVAERFCQKTPEVKNLIKIYQDPFNPYCSGGGDAKKPKPRSAISSPFGLCTKREYLTRSRVCLADFVQTLQKFPKKPCRSVFMEKLHNCAKKVALHCHRNDTSYNKKRIEAGFKRSRSFQQRRYCEGTQVQFPYPAVKHDQCGESYLEQRKKCAESFVATYVANKADKSLCGKYFEAKRCAKNVTLENCDVTPQLQDDVNFIYDEFNPFCRKLKDPSSEKKRPREKPRKDQRRSAIQDVEGKILPSRGKKITSKVSILVSVLCSVLSIIS